MEFNYAYKGSTAVSDRASSTQLSFSPDTKRPPTYFIGELRQNGEHLSFPMSIYTHGFAKKREGSLAV
ncbi:MAG: hypothetical protein GDA56_31870 [Hormoscilla sp. GM7CHS1pb]|nr:hypothetical protein [Hormoscilla sp. GM7CHS1pb]